MVRVLVACVSLTLGLSVAACGSKAPGHAGYKTKSPWKKSKQLVLDEKLTAKAKGELDYGEYKRARWYYLDLTTDGTLDLAMQYAPTDDAGDSTVAMEVLDSGFHVISEDEDAPVVEPKKGDDESEDEGDEEEDEDEDDEGSGGDTQKTRQLAALKPGRYYVHLFLTGRLDSAEYELQVGFMPVNVEAETDFPKQVSWLPSIAMVPVADDAPAVAKKPDRGRGGRGGRGGGGGSKPPPPPPPPTSGGTKAIVIGAAAASGGGTDITINGGTDAGLAAGQTGTLAGVKNGGFTIKSCSARSCKATVKASLDEVNKSSMSVTIK